jgi:hypothetical protein
MKLEREFGSNKKENFTNEEFKKKMTLLVTKLENLQLKNSTTVDQFSLDCVTEDLPLQFQDEIDKAKKRKKYNYIVNSTTIKELWIQKEKCHDLKLLNKFDEELTKLEEKMEREIN